MKEKIPHDLASIAIENTRDGVFITDAENKILYVNQAFTALTGYPAEEAIGQDPSLLKSDRHDEDFYREIWKTLLDEGRWQGSIWNTHRNGRAYPVQLTIIAVRNSDNAIHHYIGMFVAVIDIQRKQGRPQHVDQYESLNGLPGRSQLQALLAEMVRDTGNEETLLAVGVVDLDDFKTLNDTHGHHLGDRLLAVIVQRLKKVARGNDFIGRSGGDEFVLMLKDLRSVEELEQMTHRILSVIGHPYTIDSQRYQVTASIGLTIFPFDTSDPDTLLRHADQAMYKAKESGRNCYHLFDTDRDHKAQTRRQLLSRLATGLAQNELLLHYQPKVNLRTGKVIGAEALLRWQDPEHGLVAPGSFLPHAEQNDLIIEIGEWVTRQALAQVIEWRKQGLNIPVSINIAARQLLRIDFAERLKEILDEFPEAPHGCLEVEILESAALENTTHVQRIIERCRDFGIRFALDDFGTGYASLSYLRDIPTDILKIDQSFVRNILDSKDDLTLIEGAIGLGTAFQRTIIAEGVETTEQGVLLMRLGCDIAQGYGIAKPMPAENIPAWIASYRPDPQWALWADTNWEMNDFPLLVAQYDHIKWVRRILLHTDGAGLQLSPAELSDHHQCRFGHWYYGHGQSRYGHVKEFVELETIHIAVHQLGAQIVSLCEIGNEEAARQKTQALLDLKDQIIDKLASLQKNVASQSLSIAI